MDLQMAFNIALALVAFLGGWVMNSIKESVNALHAADAALTTKVQQIEVLVAGTYVKRDDLQELSRAIFLRFDKLDEKLDSKVDKT